MRLLSLCACLLTVSSLFAQSKKELQAQVNSLKTEIEQLKKPKEITLETEPKKVSYSIGVIIASNIKSQGLDSLDIDAVTAGIKDVSLNSTLKIDAKECEMILQQYMQQTMEKKSAKAKEASAKFLEENKKREGVKVTASGLQYKVIAEGKGKSPASSDNVTVHYTGKLIDGTVFDSSVERGEPATFGVSQVIPGWTEALQLMHEGDKWMLFIPFDLAYGERGAPPQILPFSTLVFEVELIKVN
jgi:FKBP-type peptidyl-prolyl cis-trans isomerase